MNRFKSVWLFAAACAVAMLLPQAALACGCWPVDIIEGPYSCYNPQTHCGKQYTHNGCNINDTSAWHCRNFQNNCCGLYNYPDAENTTVCGTLAPSARSGDGPILREHLLSVTKEANGSPRKLPR